MIGCYLFVSLGEREIIEQTEKDGVFRKGKENET